MVDLSSSLCKRLPKDISLMFPTSGDKTPPVPKKSWARKSPKQLNEIYRWANCSNKPCLITRGYPKHIPYAPWCWYIWAIAYGYGNIWEKMRTYKWVRFQKLRPILKIALSQRLSAQQRTPSLSGKTGMIGPIVRKKVLGQNEVAQLNWMVTLW